MSLSDATRYRQVQATIRSTLNLLSLSQGIDDWSWSWSWSCVDGAMWSDQLDSLLNHASERGHIVVNGVFIHQVRRISERGSPAWCLCGELGPVAKLRVDPDASIAKRIASFLGDAEACGWKGCARLLGLSGGAVLKTWVPGVPIRSCDTDERLEIVGNVARRLAELHNGSDDVCLLVCGADNYNTIRQPDGQVAFIDLESCNKGSRWIDLAWTEALLCLSEAERSLLWETYLIASNIGCPDKVLWSRARNSYLLWLREQLLRCRERHPNDAAILQDLSHLNAELVALGNKGFREQWNVKPG